MRYAQCQSTDIDYNLIPENWRKRPNDLSPSVFCIKYDMSIIIKISYINKYEFNCWSCINLYFKVLTSMLAKISLIYI